MRDADSTTKEEEINKMKVDLISITQPIDELASSEPEELIAYCARVSNPENQNT
jgi:hypothetical protein